MGQNPLSVEFLKTELKTGLTFAQLALSARREDKIERTKANARKAYDAAVKFMDRLTPEKPSELDSLLKELRIKLRDLGESI